MFKLTYNLFKLNLWLFEPIFWSKNDIKLKIIKTSVINLAGLILLHAKQPLMVEREIVTYIFRTISGGIEI